MKVHIDEPKNTLHNMLNVQNVLGFELSYENSEPPIGEPKAADTPAEAPAATSCLLMTSFRRHRNPVIGMCADMAPTLAPMWARGPSFPMQSPPATAKNVPNTLTKRVLEPITPG